MATSTEVAALNTQVQSLIVQNARLTREASLQSDTLGMLADALTLLARAPLSAEDAAIADDLGIRFAMLLATPEPSTPDPVPRPSANGGRPSATVLQFPTAPPAPTRIDPNQPY